MRRRVQHLQEQVALGEIRVAAVGGINNIADVWTKHVTVAWFMLAMTKTMGQEFAKSLNEA